MIHIPESATRTEAARLLRRTYPIFRYDAFDLAETSDGIEAWFHYSAPPDLSFTSSLTITGIEPLDLARDRALIRRLTFQLGIAEMLSYWKATCSPTLQLSAGALSHQQIAWWQTLLLQGMAEYAFVNGLDLHGDESVAWDVTTVSSVAPDATSDRREHSGRLLVPVGGGRDSTLAGCLLRQERIPFNVMLMNPRPSAIEVTKRLGVDALGVQRSLDPQLLQLNRAGYLNGHVPFSASLAFAATLCSELGDYVGVAIANERSSDEGNVIRHGHEVNHQYSKSFRFEAGFDQYIRELGATTRYFSIVRPFYELQIGAAFSEYPEFFDSFQSCNRASGGTRWCGNCPKCASVFLTSYPFINDEAIRTIFGRDYFDDLGTLAVFESLLLRDAVKPFECVCTKKEGLAAVWLSERKLSTQGREIPAVLELLRKYVPNDASWPDEVEELMRSLGPHDIPPPFTKVVERILEMCRDVSRT